MAALQRPPPCSHLPPLHLLLRLRLRVLLQSLPQSLLLQSLLLQSLLLQSLLLQSLLLRMRLLLRLRPQLQPLAASAPAPRLLWLQQPLHPLPLRPVPRSSSCRSSLSRGRRVSQPPAPGSSSSSSAPASLQLLQLQEAAQLQQEGSLWQLQWQLPQRPSQWP